MLNLHIAIELSLVVHQTNSYTAQLKDHRPEQFNAATHRFAFGKGLVISINCKV